MTLCQVAFVCYFSLVSLLILFTFNSKYECKNFKCKNSQKVIIRLFSSTLPVEGFDKLVFWIVSQNIKSKRQR